MFSKVQISPNKVTFTQNLESELKSIKFGSPLLSDTKSFKIHDDMVEWESGHFMNRIPIDPELLNQFIANDPQVTIYVACISSLMAYQYSNTMVNIPSLSYLQSKLASLRGEGLNHEGVKNVFGFLATLFSDVVLEHTISAVIYYYSKFYSDLFIFGESVDTFDIGVDVAKYLAALLIIQNYTANSLYIELQQGSEDKRILSVKTVKVPKELQPINIPNLPKSLTDAYSQFDFDTKDEQTSVESNNSSKLVVVEVPWVKTKNNAASVNVKRVTSEQVPSRSITSVKKENNTIKNDSKQEANKKQSQSVVLSQQDKRDRLVRMLHNSQNGPTPVRSNANKGLNSNNHNISNNESRMNEKPKDNERRMNEKPKNNINAEYKSFSETEEQFKSPDLDDDLDFFSGSGKIVTDIRGQKL